MINSPSPYGNIIGDGSLTSAKLNFGTFEKITTTTVGVGGATSISFTGLDLDTDRVYYIILSSKNNGVGNTDIKLEYNGDTTNTNYYIQQLWADNANVGGARANAASICNFNNSTDNIITFWICRDVSGYPRCISNSNSRAPNGILRDEFFHVYNVVANVTSIQLIAGAANGFAQDTKAHIFKVTV